MLEPHSDSMIIKANIQGLINQKLLVDEGSVTCLLYRNYWERMNLNSDHILLSQREAMNFNGAKPKPLERLMIHITLGRKIVDQDFCLMDSRASYNDIIGRDWTTRMGAVATSWY